MNNTLLKSPLIPAILHLIARILPISLESENTSEWQVFQVFDHVRPTVTGLESLPACFLRLDAPVFFQPIAYLFNLLLTTSTIPQQWKQASIIFIPKSLPPKQYAKVKSWSHAKLYSGVIVTQLLRDRFTLVTNYGQNDVCSLWMWWRRWQPCTLFVTHGCTKTFNPQHKAGAQFTDPEGMEGWVILESATSRSWTRAVSVRGECVTTRPPALMWWCWAGR